MISAGDVSRAIISSSGHGRYIYAYKTLSSYLLKVDIKITIWWNKSSSGRGLAAARGGSI
jgi:hypothetical protein